MRVGRKNLEENFKMLEKKQEITNQGITLIALVVTIVVLLILASVSITAVFGDNGLLQLAKEAGEKTNEAVQGDKENIGNMTNYIKSLSWDASKVTAVTTKDGGIVPVPKGFVGSKATGENTVSGGFVIYEGTGAVTDENVEVARKERNQFIWIPADGVSLQYAQDKETWKDKTYWYNECKDHWTDVESEEEQKIVKRAESVAQYGGFYIGRYEAGIEESTGYTNGSTYQGNTSNRNNTTGTPVTKKGRQAWNYVSQTNAKALSEKMYASSNSVTSRLIDSYAWDTICTWLSDKVSVTDSTSWGNYLNASFKIKGLYAYHQYYVEHGVGSWIVAPTYSRTTGEETKLLEAGRTYTDTISNPRKCYEIETGATVVNDEGKEINRNKANNIYDFAGNMWEWTTETETHDSTHEHADSYTKTDGTTYAVLRGGSFDYYGYVDPAAHRCGNFAFGYCHIDVGFRPVLYLL